MLNRIRLLGLSVWVVLGVTGCSSAPENAEAAKPATPQEMSKADAEIQRIKSDSALNPQAKEQRIKQIELWKKQKNGGK